MRSWKKGATPKNTRKLMHASTTLSYVIITKQRAANPCPYSIVYTSHRGVGVLKQSKPMRAVYAVSDWLVSKPIKGLTSCHRHPRGLWIGADGRIWETERREDKHDSSRLFHSPLAQPCLWLRLYCHWRPKNGGNSHWSRGTIMQWDTRQSQFIFNPTNHKNAMPANWRPCLIPYWQSYCHPCRTV